MHEQNESGRAKAMRCEARGVRKRFGNAEVLKGVDLSIPEGSFAVLVGPSGCGKSTLLRMVAGLETPDEGSISISGKDVTHAAPRDRDIAMVFQSYALYPHLTVRKNLEFGLRLRKSPEAEVAARVDEAAAMLGLSTLLDRLPRQLSGGQRQRVAMGRAIVRRAKLYLFDEPLSNLDAALRGEVRVEIRKLHERIGATTLYVTHDQVEAMTLADTLWVLRAGKVEQSGPPLEVYAHPRTEFVAGFLGSPPMNLFPAVVDGDDTGRLSAKGHGLTIPLEAARFSGALERGREVTVGIRPSHLGAAGSATIGGLAVEVVEALGAESFAYGKAGSVSLVMRLKEEDPIPNPKSTIPMYVEPKNVHLFDRTTGESLETSYSSTGLGTT